MKREGNTVLFYKPHLLPHTNILINTMYFRQIILEKFIYIINYILDKYKTNYTIDIRSYNPYYAQ